ncbi:MAG TPA: hypothetical protein VLR71_05860 [Casimicrobiaceae bacterium]|nr:hypothetical protein [Casimicrobiaceae bacterium]
MLLVAPGLLAHATACRSRPAFARLARYAGAPAVSDDGIAALVCAALGLRGTPPLGALTAAGAGLSPGTDYWMLADPVTLVAGRSDVALAGRVADLSAADADELITALNAHFHGDGIMFVAARPSLWLARVATPPALTTVSLERAQNGPLADALPRGDAAVQWRRWQDEIQMLLHTHPVNAHREALGAPPANAVWFSGGGRINDAGRPPLIEADAPGTPLGDLLRGVAYVSRLRGAIEPARIVRVHAPIAGAADVDAFTERVFEPALGKLERRELPALDLVADGGGLAAGWRATAPGALTRLTARFGPRSFTVPGRAGT